jgi:hypothetical protein
VGVRGVNSICALGAELQDLGDRRVVVGFAAAAA